MMACGGSCASSIDVGTLAATADKGWDPARIEETLAMASTTACHALQLLIEAAGDRRDVFRRLAGRMPGQQRRLAADAVSHMLVAADDAGERRLDLQELTAGAQQRGIDAFALALARDHVDGDLYALGQPLQRRDLDIGVGVGDGGGLVGGEDDAGARLSGEQPHRALDAGAEIEHDPIVVLSEELQLRPQRHEPAWGKRREAARAGASGNNIESTLVGAGHLCQRGVPRDDAAEIALGREAELHVDIGEAEIAVEEQRLASGLRQGMREGDREPGLADAAFARRDSDDVAAMRRGAGLRKRRHHGCWLHGDAFLVLARRSASAGFGRSRRASTTALQGISPFATSAVALASLKARRNASAAPMTLPKRCVMSRRVTMRRAAPRSRKMRAVSSVSTASPPAGSTSTGSARLAAMIAASSRRSAAL